MRHKYHTPALVVSRTPLSEASALVTMVTPEFGVVRARAQGLRKPGAKMGAGLQTFAESDVSMVRGKEGWRATGAILARSWASVLSSEARTRAGRVTDLVLRLTHGESMDTGAELFSLLTSYLLALSEVDRTDDEADAAELLAVLRVLHLFGVSAGETYGDTFDRATLAHVHDARSSVLARVNQGISASGL